MKAAHYLFSLGTRHNKERTFFESHIIENDQGDFVSTLGRYECEFDFHRSVITKNGNRPDAFNELSDISLLILALFFKTKLQDQVACFREILNALLVDVEHMLTYLQELGSLRNDGWLNLITDDDSVLSSEPYCYLDCEMDLGPKLHKLLENSNVRREAFYSNEEYLDALHTYFEIICNNERRRPYVSIRKGKIVGLHYDINYLELNKRVSISKANLPAHIVMKRYNLSECQHLCLMGMYFYRAQEVDYDFSDPNDIVNLFARKRAERKTIRDHLFGEKSPLLKHNLIEFVASKYLDGIRLGYKTWVEISGFDRSELNNEQRIKQIRNTKIFDCHQPKLRKGDIHFPKEVHDVLKTIVNSESPKGVAIRKRWQATLPKATGTPTGTTLLLHGESGTGKTLAAQWIASQLKRPLLKVDAAKVLSCWVGESEKHVRAIFDQYREILDEYEMTPVLLLNEADQLLGSRFASGKAVDKMHNNMQNLFLEGLEEFEGMLVATTNRNELLDDAFTRRFTYKLHIPKPDFRIRKKLWKTHLPLDFCSECVDLNELAKRELSGGDIRIIIDKAVRHAAYSQISRLTHEKLLALTIEETGYASRKEQRVRGFSI